MNKFWIDYNAVLLALILSSLVLYFGEPVFMPLALAGLLALVFMRPSGWLERRGMPRLVTALLSGLVFLALVAGVILLVNWYVHRFAQNLPDLEKKIQEMAGQVRRFLKDQWGLRLGGGTGRTALVGASEAGKMTTSVLGGVLGGLINFILTVVYMVMLLTMRAHLRKFLLKLVRPENKERMLDVMNRSVNVAQEYMYGMLIVIAFLWVMYGVAFSLIGVHYAVFFAILCGTLEIVPFVGNITGSTLTCIMALTQGGGIHMAIEILVAYGVIQTLQFYIVAPLVMRAQVNLSPIFTIVVLIAGDLLWGIPGMIMAIPYLGMLKIVCDKVPFLQSFGFLLGREPHRRIKK